ncbi:hypothetical protein ACIOUF_00335 [Pseudomonas iridis]|uniref:Uncharacterized protein n=1 Tax=Pseudomonas iridis TaxID=2710587 RepID=A0ABW8DFI6_9PSED
MSTDHESAEWPASHPGKTVSGVKDEVEGTIEGHVKNLSTGVSHLFSDPWIWRDEQAGTLRFHGVVPDPEKPGALVGILLTLASAAQPGGKFQVGAPEIEILGYLKYHPDQLFHAESGEVTLERQPENRINGTLKFTTTSKGGEQYRVDVIFDIGAP